MSHCCHKYIILYYIILLCIFCIQLYMVVCIDHVSLFPPIFCSDSVYTHRNATPWCACGQWDLPLHAGSTQRHSSAQWLAPRVTLTRRYNPLTAKLDTWHFWQFFLNVIKCHNAVFFVQKCHKPRLSEISFFVPPVLFLCRFYCICNWIWGSFDPRQSLYALVWQSNGKILPNRNFASFFSLISFSPLEWLMFV